MTRDGKEIEMLCFRQYDSSSYRFPGIASVGLEAAATSKLGREGLADVGWNSALVPRLSCKIHPIIRSHFRSSTLDDSSAALLLHLVIYTWYKRQYGRQRRAGEHPLSLASFPAPPPAR